MAKQEVLIEMDAEKPATQRRRRAKAKKAPELSPVYGTVYLELPCECSARPFPHLHSQKVTKSLHAASDAAFARAKANPVVQRIQELFGARIRSTSDLREGKKAK